MKFSIITPVYNREDCVARCIESVLNQQAISKNEYEHIIVNDGSIDRSGSIIREYAEKYSNIVYIEFSKNRGTNAGRNAAIKKATGDFCIILDSDDYFVEDALDVISRTIENKSGYKHYMFASDDRKEFFDNREDLRKERIITFKDFLSQKYIGDFIHVINRNIMQKYPFDESLRIHEGVFFLSFYKEAQNICFTNTVITIRERGREDSVSKEYLRTNTKSINSAIKAAEITLGVFEKDYIECGLNNILNNIYSQLFDNYLLISDYKKCKEILGFIQNKKIISKYRQLIYSLRLGFIYRALLYLYLRIKYSIIRVK